MELNKLFILQGNFLFRYRSYMPLLFLPVILIAAYFNHFEIFNLVWKIFFDLGCIFLFLLGFIIRIFTVGHVPKRTSGRNRKKQIADKLNTKGIYSIVRHPLYLGNFLMWIGIVMYFRSISATIIFMLIFFLYYERIICAEETFLESKFKNEFTQWAAETPAFIPDFKLWKRSDLSFSFTNVLKREYSGFLSGILSFIVICVMRNYFLYGHIEVKSYDLYILGIGLVITAILRLLRKYTKILNVEGR